jgi:hypothetical protein
MYVIVITTSISNDLFQALGQFCWQTMLFLELSLIFFPTARGHIGAN